MPSALVYRIAAPTNCNSGAAASGEDFHVKASPLPRKLILDLSLHAPALLSPLPDTISAFHGRRVSHGQVAGGVVRRIAAPIDAVWSLLRRFDNPLAYKPFLKSCRVIAGDGGVGTIREVRVVSGLPAVWSTERLDLIDEDRHAFGFSILDGEHRLRNYRSVTTLHPVGDGETVVVESYVVDVPAGNTREETCAFVDTIVRCNLNSLAEIAAGKVEFLRV